MRFSLLTLLLVAFWLGAAMGVWFRREPWVFNRLTESESRRYSAEERDRLWEAPDKIRGVGQGDAKDARGNAFPAGFKIVYLYDLEEIYTHDCRPHILMPSEPLFLDNDTITVHGYTPVTDVRVRAYYYRRFPEWWWGHFYRPEVWVLIGLTLLIAWRASKRFRRYRSTPIVNHSYPHLNS